MFLVTAATRYEMEGFASACPLGLAHDRLITGIGPVESALRLSLFLALKRRLFCGVINLGTAGAYFQTDDQPAAQMLDICLAETEVLGDFGICYERTLERLPSKKLEIHDFFKMDTTLLDQAEKLLKHNNLPFCRGAFITVSCVSATKNRGKLLRQYHQAICENMEGAAIARVCRHFALPLLELRCISNYVEDRDDQKWKLKEACARCGEAAALVLKGLSNG